MAFMLCVRVNMKLLQYINCHMNYEFLWYIHKHTYKQTNTRTHAHTHTINVRSAFMFVKRCRLLQAVFFFLLFVIITHSQFVRLVCPDINTFLIDWCTSYLLTIALIYFLEIFRFYFMVAFLTFIVSFIRTVCDRQACN